MQRDIQLLAQMAGQAAQAESVYLFGSQARGNAHDDSDVDLALIVPDGVNSRDALRAAIHATSKRVLALDLVVIAHSTWLNGRSLLARQVRQEGFLLYGG